MHAFVYSVKAPGAGSPQGIEEICSGTAVSTKQRAGILFCQPGLLQGKDNDGACSSVHLRHLREGRFGF